MPPTLGISVAGCNPWGSGYVKSGSRHRIPNDLHGGGSNGKVICRQNPVGLISIDIVT